MSGPKLGTILEQRQRPQQIPFGNDKQESESKKGLWQRVAG